MLGICLRGGENRASVTRRAFHRIWLTSALGQARKQFSVSEERYRDLYEVASVGYFFVTADAVIRDCNDQAVDTFGHAREEILGRPILELCADTPEGKPKAVPAIPVWCSRAEIPVRGGCHPNGAKRREVPAPSLPRGSQRAPIWFGAAQILPGAQSL